MTCGLSQFQSSAIPSNRIRNKHDLFQLEANWTKQSEKLISFKVLGALNSNILFLLLQLQDARNRCTIISVCCDGLEDSTYLFSYNPRYRIKRDQFENTDTLVSWLHSF